MIKMVPSSSASLFQLLLLLLLFTIVQRQCSSSSESEDGSELVEKVCKQTSNRSFCAESLYSDVRTQKADRYTLAFISVGLAYVNATDTRDYISELLNHGHEQYHQPLLLCFRNYKKAVSSLEMAYNDLNSETFFELADLASRAGAAANDCESAFQGNNSKNKWRPLGYRNKDLKGLCEICGIVAKIFTGLLI